MSREGMGEGSAPPSSSMIGRVINDYQVIEKLAEGGMGAVYLARHRLLVNTKKVVKILRPSMRGIQCCGNASNTKRSPFPDSSTIASLELMDSALSMMDSSI